MIATLSKAVQQAEVRILLEGILSRDLTAVQLAPAEEKEER